MCSLNGPFLAVLYQCPHHTLAVTHCKEDWVSPTIFWNWCSKYLLHRLRTPDRPVGSDWLDRLSYSGPHCCCRSSNNGSQSKLCLLYHQLCYGTYWAPQTFIDAPGHLRWRDWPKTRWCFDRISLEVSMYVNRHGDLMLSRTVVRCKEVNFCTS